MLQVDQATTRAFMLRFVTCKPVPGDGEELHVKTCPRCGDSKFRVYFNTRKGVGFCHRHGCAPDLFAFAKVAFGVTTLSQAIKRLQEYRGEGFRLVFNAEEDPEKVRRRDRVLAHLARNATPQEVPAGGLPKDFRTDWTKPLGQRIRAYADARGIPSWFLDSGRAGYCFGVRRLFALVLEDQKVVYWVARAIDREVEPRYLTPKRTDYGRRSGDVVFNLDLFQEGGLMIVAEGWISALSAGENAVAILGHHLTHTQAVKIVTANPGGVVFLREAGVSPVQAQRSAWEIQRRGVPAFVADLVDGDPNDNPGQMPTVLAAAQPGGKGAMLRARASVLRRDPAYPSPRFDPPEEEEEDAPVL